ncbi:SPOR domain-containing protein [Salinispirillum sp. LH 10-3-1]|uniref:SPOR domain-containing protein n=1 Tax=Salinispirillum sp. LH 10-3-1 TaxID=2952525 RepID=A0AB38YCB8_9GAMM
MDNTQKKRLVGALVLSVFLLLALPVLFTGQGRLPEARITDIPPPPELSVTRPIDVDHDAPVAVAELTQRVDQLINADPTPEQRAEAPPPTPAASDSAPRQLAYTQESTGEISAWSVQMGSFRQADNARRLLDELRTAGYEAYTKETVLSDGSLLTQVMVGPDPDHDRVRLKKDILSEEFNLPTLVVRFQP